MFEQSFPEFKKIPRLFRQCVVTEKLDGTNGLVYIGPELLDAAPLFLAEDGMRVYAGSKSRWLDTSSQGDNYGFAKWVETNAEELVKLGPGHHYGEWYGRGIQGGYGLPDRRFALFNSYRWSDPSVRPACCSVVPVLYNGVFSTDKINELVADLRRQGSVAVPQQPAEGVIVYLEASKQYYKVTCEKDEEYKGFTAPKVRPAKQKREANVGGRRKAQVAIEFPDRRKA
jgi:hypothetical protein